MFHQDKFDALVKPRNKEAAERRRKQREEWIKEWTKKTEEK